MDDNYIFFVENLHSLVEKYEGKFIVIKEQSVIAVFDSFSDAYARTIITEELGSFIIQLCSQDALLPSAKFAWNNVTFSPVST